MENIENLNKAYADKRSVTFEEQDNDVVIIKIENQFAQCEISMYGAQVLSFIPKGKEDVLYVSPDTKYGGGAAIRGGIPVCFPWFGPNATDSSLPQHGFARIMNWNLVDVSEYVSGETYIRMALKNSEATKKYWDYRFHAELTVVIGERLEVNLIVQNADDRVIKYTDALHTYFSVADIDSVKLGGLKGESYYWGFEEALNVQDQEMLSIDKEENRRYINAESLVEIHDEANSRKIIADKRGSTVSVVWNPWKETCRAMADVPDEDYKKFVCVEAVNAYDGNVELMPGGHHATTVIIGVEDL